MELLVVLRIRESVEKREWESISRLDPAIETTTNNGRWQKGGSDVGRVPKEWLDGRY